MGKTTERKMVAAGDLQPGDRFYWMAHQVRVLEVGRGWSARGRQGLSIHVVGCCGAEPVVPRRLAYFVDERVEQVHSWDLPRPDPHAVLLDGQAFASQAGQRRQRSPDRDPRGTGKGL